MRHPILLLAFILANAANSFCQSRTKFVNSFKFSYGLFYPIESQFKNPMEKFENKLHYPLSFLSIAYEHPRSVGKRNRPFEYGLNYFLNQVRSNPDSIKTNWCAVDLYLVQKYDLLPKSKYFDFFIGFGGLIGWQILNVRKEYLETYRNFNASIIPHVELRIQPTERVSIGLSTDFLIDGTQSKWKKFGSKKYSINSSRFTGTMVKFFLGWSWGKR